MKIILAFDSFKGSLTAQEVTETVSKVISCKIPDCDLIEIPISDGGEGFTSILARHFHAERISCSVHNPLGNLIHASYTITSEGTAIMEMAEASGLSLIPAVQRNPLNTSSYGVGDMMKDALAHHCKKIILGIGGSATNDGGMGMLSALGFRFYDKNGKLLDSTGKNLQYVESIDTSSALNLSDVELMVASDVQNPLFGVDGAAYIFAPQKGATPEDVAMLDQGLQNYAKIMNKTFGKQYAFDAGAGAAGGLGFALMHLGATLLSGAELVLRSCQFDELLRHADLVLTGEGKMDKQTLMGKAPASVLHHAQQAHVPVIGITGIAEDAGSLKQAGFQDILQITPPDCDLEEALKPGIAKENIRKTVSTLCSKITTNF